MRSQRLEQFIDVYRQLDASTLDRLERVYHPQIDFVDPFHQLNGLPALRHYFEDLFTHVSYCRFEFQATQELGDEAYLHWRMDFIHPRLNCGREIQLPGISHIRFDANAVIYHRDYYDGGALVYEHVPVIGAVIRALKRRMRT